MTEKGKLPLPGSTRHVPRKTAQRTPSAQSRSKYCECLAGLGPNWPTCGQARQNSADSGAQSYPYSDDNSVDSGHSFAKFARVWPNSTNSGRSWANFGPNRPNVAEVDLGLATLSQNWPNNGPTRSEVADVRPNLGPRGNFGTEHRRIRGRRDGETCQTCTKRVRGANLPTRTCAEICRHDGQRKFCACFWSGLGPNGPISAKSSRRLAELWRLMAKLGRDLDKSVQSGPNLAKSRPTLNQNGPIWAE